METSAANTLDTPGGVLDFTVVTRPRFKVLNVHGFDTPDLRVVTDPMPQGDGSIGHNAPWGSRHFDLELLMDVDSATDRSTLSDNWKAAADSLRRADGRFYFTPTGKAQRFVTVRLDGKCDEESVVTGAFGEAAGILKKVTIPLRADNPYAVTAAEHTAGTASGHPELTNGGTLSITNAGKAISWPVLKIWGPYTKFTITNTTLGLALAFGNDVGDTLSVASGHYIEVITGPVVHSAYLDGNTTNMLGHQDSSNLDWPYLAVGANSWSAAFTGGSGATKAEFLINDAWL